MAAGSRSAEKIGFIDGESRSISPHCFRLLPSEHYSEENYEAAPDLAGEIPCLPPSIQLKPSI
jgi:hypothetical protein